MERGKYKRSEVFGQLLRGGSHIQMKGRDNPI